MRWRPGQRADEAILGRDEWKIIAPSLKLSPAAPPGGEKNASWGAQRLEMLLVNFTDT